MGLVDQYKGDQSNYDMIKSELENVIEELAGVNRLKVTREFSEEMLQEIKKLRLSILTITD